MKISIYGKSFNQSFIPFIEELFRKLNREGAEIFLYQPFFDFINRDTDLICEPSGFFTSSGDLSRKTDFMISIGGDGTFLEAVGIAQDSNIPIVGLNSGRLGFLANISKESITESINEILSNKFTYEHRSLIHLTSPSDIFHEFPYGLNEVTIQKKDSSMITVHTYINDEFLNSYWTDGLIVSTPTGSTAYAMSVGGPIIEPDCNNFIIAPIASHNLTVRPILIPDNVEITLKMDGRADKFLVTVDNRTASLSRLVEIKLKKADFSIRMLKLHTNTFYKTIRNKLMWGVDKRN